MMTMEICGNEFNKGNKGNIQPRAPYFLQIKRNTRKIVIGLSKLAFKLGREGKCFNCNR